MAHKLFPVILCGGSGSRLWPLSREHFPKQLLSLVNSTSLLQDTVSRLSDMQSESAKIIIESPVVVTNENHRFLVAEQILESGYAANKIILESAGKNTAPALALAALSILESDPNGLMLVMPSDHVIADTEAFHAAVVQGIDLVVNNVLVTFGIVPKAPETGFGYIKKGVLLEDNICSIGQFIEKPNLETAEQYVASGNFLWNSGMFLLKASVWLDALKHCRPDIEQAVSLAFKNGSEDFDFFRVDAEAFSLCPSESIDYAVMEKVTEQHNSGFRAAVIPLDAGWSDVGSWDSLWEVSEKSDHGNVIRGDVLVEDTQGSMIFANHRLVSTVGVSDLIVVETADAVLVSNKSSAQEVKTIVNRLQKKSRQEAVLHRKVARPWGSYESIDAGERFQVKRIIVKPGASLSSQMHHHRAEHWIVVKGTAKVTRGEDTFILSENQSTYIPLGVTHRLASPGTIVLEIIEVQSGSYLGEDDIVRFEDVYGRSKEGRKKEAQSKEKKV